MKMFLIRNCVVFLLVLRAVNALYLYVPSATTKCIEQELDNEDSAIFTTGRVEGYDWGTLYLVVSGILLILFSKSENVSIFCI